MHMPAARLIAEGSLWSLILFLWPLFLLECLWVEGPVFSRSVVETGKIIINDTLVILLTPIS